MPENEIARSLRATGDEPLEVVNSGAEDWIEPENEIALPPHDHTVEPGEINRCGCERCEIERKLTIAIPCPRCGRLSCGCTSSQEIA